jgi:Zn-dependent peptidase ImmA (M78 family)
MQQARRDQINRLADTIRSACDLSVPVDVQEAVSRLKGQLEEVEDADFEAMIQKVGEGFRIVISIEKHEHRRRFSVAHELGHLFLHMGYLVDEEKWASVGTYTDSVYYRYGYTTEEYEAHEFAAAFLMPRTEFLKVANQYKTGNRFQIVPIAEHFQVSTDAAANRGRWLGLFNWE